MSADVLIIGPATRDVNTDYDGRVERSVGGAIWFGAAAAACAGARVGAALMIGPEDGDIAEAFPGLGVRAEDVHVIPSGSATEMHNTYFTKDRERRKATCPVSAEVLTPEHFPEIKAKLYDIAGLIRGDIDTSMIPFLAKKGKLSCDVQGFIRCRDGEELHNEDWDEKKKWLPYFDFLKTDAAEAETLTGTDDRREAAKILYGWGAKEILISYNTEMLVYDGKEFYTEPVKSRNFSGRTGRGDTVFSSYIARRMLGDTPGEALLFATALVSLKMETPGPARCTKEDVQAYIREFYQSDNNGGKKMKIRVGVAGYGTIGQRLADGVAMQGDMELVGIADLAPTLSLKALRENDMIGANGVKYDLYLVEGADPEAFKEADIPVAGTFDELCQKVDVMLDSAPGGVGAKNKEKYYEKYGVKAIFQGGEKNSVADVFFHGYANYEKGLGQDYLKLTSCNTTGLIRSVDCLDREFGIEKVAITIIRRVADPGDYHRGLTNALQMDKAPSHQAVDLMTIMPHIEATGILVHTPVTHGHIITVVATAKDGRKLHKEEVLAAFQKHPRIRVVTIDEGFKGNASLFKYARDLGNRRGDMYEIGLWADSIVESGNDIMYAINIPQESVTIPETIDGIRAVMKMQLTREEATAETNKYLNIGKFKR